MLYETFTSAIKKLRMAEFSVDEKGLEIEFIKPKVEYISNSIYSIAR